jgi:hypothetical protein
MLAAVDLHGCKRAAMADPENIRAFTRALVDALGLRARGPVRLERFTDAELEGWSATQPVEKSSITVQVGKVGALRFADVFAGRPFDAQVAATVAVEHFGGTHSLRVLRR